jgi:hypothetical protein
MTRSLQQIRRRNPQPLRHEGRVQIRPRVGAGTQKMQATLVPPADHVVPELLELRSPVVAAEPDEPDRASGLRLATVAASCTNRSGAFRQSVVPTAPTRKVPSSTPSPALARARAPESGRRDRSMHS